MAELAPMCRDEVVPDHGPPADVTAELITEAGTLRHE